MAADEPWEAQRKLKYRDHDVVLEDLKPHDFDSIRSNAQRGFIETRESDQVKLICGAFVSFLTSKGYRITKKEQT